MAVCRTELAKLEDVALISERHACFLFLPLPEVELQETFRRRLGAEAEHARRLSLGP